MEELANIVMPYTMASPERIRLLIKLAANVVNNRVPGDVVECGVWNGGAAAVLAHFAAKAGCRTWLFDSFEGLPNTTKEDTRSADGDTAESHIGQCRGSVDRVKEVLALVGANMRDVEIVRGWFQDTFLDVSIPQIAMLSLDSDWYASEMLCLNKFYGCVSPGGFVYFDDFYFWPGCRKAAEEFFATRAEVPRFNQVGHSMWLQKREHD